MEHPAQDPARPAPVPDRVRRRLDEVFGDVLPDVTRDEVVLDPTTDDGTDGSSRRRPGSGRRCGGAR